MNKNKQPPVKMTFRKVIHQNAFNEPCKQSLLVNSNQMSNSMHMSSKGRDGREIKIREQAEMMLRRLEDYQDYYMRLMQLQRKKYLQHFTEMYTIIRSEQQVGLFYLNKQVQRMIQEFELKKKLIANTAEDLLRKQSFKKLRLQEKLENLDREMSLEIGIFQVKLSDLNLFKNQVKKYTMPAVTSKESNIEDSLPVQFLEEREQIQRKEMREQATQTEHVFEESLESTPVHEVDELLGCDQDMSKKLSTSSRRRLKYAVGRRDVIKEQDESSENSSIISEN